MKSQKYLPKTTISGRIIDNDNIKEFNAAGKPGINFTVIVKDVWKDKEGNKHESEPYYADCVAFGQERVNIVKDIKNAKQMAVIQVLPKLEKWTGADGVEKSKTKFVASRIEGWYYENAEWHTNENDFTAEVNDLPF